jgi:hypothetical protein
MATESGAISVLQLQGNILAQQSVIADYEATPQGSLNTLA